MPGVEPGDVALECSSGGPVFSLATLEAAPPIEPAGVDAASDGLARELQGTGDPGMPVAGWRRVAYSSGQVLFVASAPPGGDSPFLQVALVLRNGAWELDTIGACAMSVVFESGLDTAQWSLDPDAPPPAADDTRIAAFVHERACASGASAEGRIAPPVIVYGDRAIVVTFATRPLGGGQDCQSNPPTPHEFELEEPLGERTLLDGSAFPLTDAGVPVDER